MYTGTWNRHSVAIKVCNAPSGKAARNLGNAMANEIVLHSTLDHPNVLPMFGYCRNNNVFYVVTKLMAGSVSELLFPNMGECTLTSDEKKFIVFEIAK